VVIIQSLRKLDHMETQLARNPEGSSETSSLLLDIQAIREVIPTAILRHHDRMKARGKMSVAPVRGGVCDACHLKIPLGHLLKLSHPGDLSVCDNCGAFIYLAVETPAPAAAPSVARKKRKSK
jgi:predicted  nucleic acid-binding Zn-ribbon protein